MVFDKATEEAYQLQWASPDGTPEANLAPPTADPDLVPNNGDMPNLEHYKNCISGCSNGGT